MCFKMKIQHLPDDCLLFIFGTIPVVDHIHRIQLVCHRWCILHQKACRRIKSLSLIGKHYTRRSYIRSKRFAAQSSYLDAKKSFLHQFIQHHGDLIAVNSPVHHLELRLNNSLVKGSTCTWLLNRFTKIEHLELIHILLEEQTSEVSHLLDGWNDTLTELKVFYVKEKYGPDGQDKTKQINMGHFLYQLMNQIANLPKLQRLILKLRGLYLNDWSPTSQQNIDLPNLKELHLINFSDSDKQLFDSLFYNTNFRSLTKLTFDSKLIVYDPKRITQMARMLFGQLTHLSIDLSLSTLGLDLINSFCTKKLYYLHLTCVNDLSLVKLSYLLVNVAAHLAHFRVDFFDYHYPSTHRPTPTWSPWSQETSTCNFKALCTLHLCTSNLLHIQYTNAACILLAQLFPQMSSLILDGNLAFGGKYRMSNDSRIRENCSACAVQMLGSKLHSTSIDCKRKLTDKVVDKCKMIRKIYVEVEPCNITLRQRFEMCRVENGKMGNWTIVTLKQI